mmetsp:Transcript_35907/g.36589  ORF Transcript_35907/g.36589 Transcript_35907/m.36589 type:complete len:385 (-) Transcript_35907:85-1239(-)
MNFKWILISLLHSLSSSLDGDYSLGFLHMRKAGGTLMRQVFEKWVRGIGCSSSTEKLTLILGLRNGLDVQLGHKNEEYKNAAPLCPSLNMVHEEYGCLDGNSIANIPTRHHRKHILNYNLTLFTTLRDPIERSCSQAFYGKGDIGYKTFNETVKQFCGRHLTRSSLRNFHDYCNKHSLESKKYSISCQCFSLSWNHSLEMLKSNETIWYDWMNQKHGLRDQYMPNYYIHRLAGFASGDIVKKKFQTAKECIFHSSQCPENRYTVLKSVVASTKSRRIKIQNITQSLELCKHLLKEQFDFLITENITSLVSSNAIKSALFRIHAINMSEYGVHNSGILTTVGGTYREILPKPVRERMERENAADIELYRYAVELFHQRAIEEGWN